MILPTRIGLTKRGKLFLLVADRAILPHQFLKRMFVTWNWRLVRSSSQYYDLKIGRYTIKLHPEYFHIIKHSLRSEEHTSELQSLRHLVCRLLLEKKNNYNSSMRSMSFAAVPASRTCIVSAWPWVGSMSLAPDGIFSNDKVPVLHILSVLSDGVLQ